MIRIGFSSLLCVSVWLSVPCVCATQCCYYLSQKRMAKIKNKNCKLCEEWKNNSWRALRQQLDIEKLNAECRSNGKELENKKLANIFRFPNRIWFEPMNMEHWLCAWKRKFRKKNCDNVMYVAVVDSDTPSKLIWMNSKSSWEEENWNKNKKYPTNRHCGLYLLYSEDKKENFKWKSESRIR